MSSFFTALGGTYAQGLLQKKQQTHQDDMTQQKQYLDMLNAAANSPAAQSWSPDQWRTYTDAVINAGDVKSQKDPKKSGLGGILQKVTGGPKGGSNLQEKLQQIFGGGGGPMAQTAGPGAPSASSGGATPTLGVSGQFNPPFSSQVAGAPEGYRIPSGQLPTGPAGALPASPSVQGTPAVGPMPESFAPRTGPPSLQKTVRGGATSGPPTAPLTLGGSKVDYGQRPDLILRDPNTGHHVGHYVGKDGKVSTIDYGPGQTEQEFDIQQRAKAQTEKAQALRNGDLDTAIRLGMASGDYADYETGKLVEGPKYRKYLEDKWNAPAEKHRAALAAEVDRAGRLVQRTQEYNLNYNNYLLRAHGQQRADAELQLQQTNKAVSTIDTDLQDLYRRREKVDADMDKEYSTPPNPRLNPNDTQEAKEARIQQYHSTRQSLDSDIATKLATREARINVDPWMNTKDLTQPVGPPPRRPRTGSTAPPARKSAAPTGSDSSNPLGLRKPQ